MNIGDKVRVLHPFDCPFDGEHTIVDIINGVYFLSGIDGGFDAMYLEAV